MIESNYKTYRTFNEYPLAEELAMILQKYEVKCVIEDTSVAFDVSFANNPIHKEYSVKLNPADFPKVNAILEKEAAMQVNEVSEDHYLFTFSDEELRQLVAKRDEWSDLDFVLAQKILAERGADFEIHEIANLQEKRLEELGTPEPVNPTWIYAGFLFALLGGLFGIIMGWFIFSNTKTLPNGKTIHCYSKSDRDKGSAMFIIGVVVLVSMVLLRIIKQVNYH
jgi:hypothetical protein